RPIRFPVPATASPAMRLQVLTVLCCFGSFGIAPEKQEWLRAAIWQWLDDPTSPLFIAERAPPVSTARHPDRRPEGRSTDPAGPHGRLYQRRLSADCPPIW